MENNELGKLLKSFRERAFKDQGLRRVAEQVEIDYSHLFRIEAGQYIPSDENLLKLLNAYKASPTDKLQAFNLARLSPDHRKISDQAYKHDPQAAVSSFFRKNKGNKPKN